MGLLRPPTHAESAWQSLGPRRQPYSLALIRCAGALYERAVRRADGCVKIGGCVAILRDGVAREIKEVFGGFRISLRPLIFLDDFDTLNSDSSYFDFPNSRKKRDKEMAPRRGGGGSYGGSSSSSPVCPGFLDSPSPYGSIQIAYYVSYCLFFVLTFGALIYTCCVVKRATRLLRLLLVVLSFMSLYVSQAAHGEYRKA